MSCPETTQIEILQAIVVPIVIALIGIFWPEIQSLSKRKKFLSLIRRELEEIGPYPTDRKMNGWWEHQQKEFVHQKIFTDINENKEFILSLPPELVYFVTQLWLAKKNKNKVQWLFYLSELKDYQLDVGRFDENRKISQAFLEWGKTIKLYPMTDDELENIEKLLTQK